MLVTGVLLELKLTTLGRICYNLKNVGLVVLKTFGLLFEEDSLGFKSSV